MALFIFNKLVRDNLRAEYERLNQRAVYRKLSRVEHSNALKYKIIEEASEITPELSHEELIGELADISQVIDDIMALHSIAPEDVATAQQRKFEKKGGFSGATFIATLELDEDDEWTAYYRKSPDVFHEIKTDDKV